LCAWDNSKVTYFTPVAPPNEPAEVA
jgi:hypothetical protein